MAIIEKKIWPRFFDKICSGEKTFDYRLADFECNVGDVLLLKEYDPEKKTYTGRQIEKTVTYVARTKEQSYWPEEQVEKHGFLILAFK